MILEVILVFLGVVLVVLEVFLVYSRGGTSGWSSSSFQICFKRLVLETLKSYRSTHQTYVEFYVESHCGVKNAVALQGF